MAGRSVIYEARVLVAFIVLKAIVYGLILFGGNLQIKHLRIPMSIQYGRRATMAEARALHDILLRKGVADDG